jgi:digeranylgeranylglycerophospholipid reductase
MAKKYDVIIVGAGPAGFLAAKAAGENGLEVALVERKTDVTALTRACGQTLVSMNEYYFGNLVRYNARDKRISFSSDGFSFKYDGPYQNLYNLRMYTPSGHNVDFGDYEEQKRKGDYGRVGLVFDKEILFQCLLEEVKARSVDVFPGINVDKVATTADGVKVEGSGQSFEGTYLIAADGVNSRIAKMTGFNKDRYYYCNFYGLSYYMSGVEPPDPPDMIVKTAAFLKEGESTLFVLSRPTEGEYNIMPITTNPKVDLEMALDYFMTKAFCAPWFKKAKKLRVFSGVCNCYSPIIEPYKDRILVAGDVGSTQELEITGAMVSGWKAGQAAATAVQEENMGLETNGISQYVNWWKEAYINFYNHEDYLRGFVLPYILSTEEEMSYVYGLIQETLAACWNPYSGGKVAGPAMAKALPIIQRERPEIFQKLARKSLPIKELLAEVTEISKPV